MKAIKTKTIELPTFEQLTDEQKEKVLENYYDINIDGSYWYEHVLDEAKELGFKITEFDTERGTIKAGLIKDAVVVANNILKEHGEACDTYKIAKAFLDAHSKLDDDSVEQDALVSEFETDLANDYLSILKAEFEYATSREAIESTLIANEYTFNAETLMIDN
jgi:hypothetical protein